MTGMAEDGMPSERHRGYYEELARTAADAPLRARLRQLGVTEIGDAAIAEWHGDAADVVDLLGGGKRRIEADTLVTATVNDSQRWLEDELQHADVRTHAIGDCVAARLVVMAIHEGRELAQRMQAGVREATAGTPPGGRLAAPARVSRRFTTRNARPSRASPSIRVSRSLRRPRPL